MATEKNDSPDVTGAPTGGEEKRHIARIQIRDVLAIESLDLEVGNDGLTISGRTGSGKTSILDSISAAFGRTARSEMVRQGTERGELLVVLDDGSQISREITPDGLASPVVRDPSGQAIKRPAAYLNQIMPGLGLNPVEFLTAKDDKQIRMLADAFPVKVTLAELQELAGEVDLSELEPKVSQMSGLELAMAATRLVKSQLSEKNTLIKRAETQGQALKAQIPAGFNPDEIRGVSTADLANELSRIGQHNRVVAESQIKVTKLDKAMAQGQNKIEQIQAEIERLQLELKGCHNRMDELKAEKEGVQNWLAANPVVETTDLEMRLQSLDQSRVVLGHYDQVQRLETEANDLKEESSGLRAAKERLEAFPAQLTAKANIPIDGLSIQDDRILIDGLPVGNLSDGERLRLAIQIAAAGAGDLGFVCVDGAERLSEDVREELLSALEARGIQFFLTEVTNEDLAIRPRRQPAERVAERESTAESVAIAAPVAAVAADVADEVIATVDAPTVAVLEVEQPPVEAQQAVDAEVIKAVAAASAEAVDELLSLAKDAPRTANADVGLGAFAPPVTGNGSVEQWEALRAKTEAQDAQFIEEDVPDLGEPSPAHAVESSVEESSPDEDMDLPGFDEEVAQVAPHVVQAPVYEEVPDFGFD